ncbi:MAG: HAMP domain-containing sensor histidine kinase [Nocardioides sp.]|uniref:sensor histidine kinase n=1 Tax=Nocardioides sp. TaxID=35761 RepID=UPI00326597D6
MNQPDIEAVFVDALQNIAEGVTDLVGFEVAAISVARDDHTLEMVAVAGSSEARDQLLGSRTPIARIERELGSAEAWGDLRFVPHERMSIEVDELSWVPDLELSDDPDVWHPLDLLLAPIRDEQGRLRGLLSVDVPRDRRRPGPGQREQLQRYARQTRRSVLTALERAEFAEQVRLADAARTIVRQVSSELSIGRIIEICQPAVTVGFKAVGMWLQTFDPDSGGADEVYGATDGEIVVPEEFKLLGRKAAGPLWATQEVAVVTDELMPVIAGLDLDADQVARVRDFMATTLEASSMLFVPIGAGQECLGNLALTRRGPSPEWTLVEQQAALEIGHDLGRALVNARTFERERILLEEVRELAGYKSRLITTISHELKNPLTSILGHIEMVESGPDLPDSLSTSISAMGRAADRMRSIIDDLLVLAQVADPETALDPEPVDLAKVVDDVLDLLRVSIDQQELHVVLQAPCTPVCAWGEVDGLFRVCVNLVSNAVKYTPRGGTITTSLAHTPHGIELIVTDTGLGISASDQQHLFQEFFRSNNPAAVAMPGTGLGLSIVHRIVERHRGRIRVSSALGAGTTFVVTLPPAP